MDTSLCRSGEAALNFTKTFTLVDGCKFAYFSQYVCKAIPSTTTTATTTSTTREGIRGLTPEEAAVYNPNIASYWDYQHCGRASDNHHWDWCGQGKYRCQETVAVDTSLCRSGEAVLNFTKTFTHVDGCHFAYFSQYVCRGISANAEFAVYAGLEGHYDLVGHEEASTTMIAPSSGPRKLRR